MTQEEREKMFEGEVKKVKKDQENKENKRKNYIKTYEKIEFVPLEQNVNVVVRFLGETLSYRSEPTSMKRVLHTSKALDDNGRFSKITWSDDKNWFLWKIYNLVMAYQWNQEKEYREYLNREKCPKIFNRIAKNDKVDNPMEKGWTPDNFVVCNVIDRQDMDWHKQNKHTKLLSKKVSTYNDILFAEIGIPITLYEMLISEIVEYQGDFEDYDVIIRKLDAKPFYQIRHPITDAIKLKKDDPTILQIASIASLSDEERLWEKYNIDKLFRVTSHCKLMNRFGKLIKEIDVEFKKHFYEELEQLCEKERDLYKNTNGVEGNESETEDDDSVENKVENKEEPVITKTESTNDVSTKSEPVRKTRAPKIESQPIDWQEMVDMGLKGISFMTDEEKKLVIDMNDEGNFSYDYDSEKLYDCRICGFPAPDIFHYCPKCAKKFD